MRRDVDGAAPRLSIVLVALDGAEALAETLAALRDQRDAPSSEIVLPADARLRAALERAPRQLSSDPRLRVVEVRADHAEPSILRGAGVRAARGAIVAVIEDHTLPAPEWAASIVRAHDGPDGASRAAVGGVVEKRLPDRALGWAMYLLDYGRYMPPLPAGPSASLTSCNVSYKAAALRDVATSWPDAFRETDVHWALRDRGATLWLDPAIVVQQRRAVPLRRALAEWFSYGVEFATTRARAEGRLRSVARAIATPLLPAVFAARAWAHLARVPHRAGIFVRALPAIIALGAAWAAGEATGALRGAR